MLFNIYAIVILSIQYHSNLKKYLSFELDKVFIITIASTCIWEEKEMKT